MKDLPDDLVRQWSPENSITITEARRNDEKTKYLWDCDKGHTWRATMRHRLRGSGCTWCANNAATPGVDDLTITHPDLARQYRGEIPVGYLTARSYRKVPWECEHGHEWTAAVSDRAIKGSGCPYCFGRKAIPGETDLGTLRPDVAALWHPDNPDSPSEYTIGSAHVALWQCAKVEEHTYSRKIMVMTRRISQGKEPCILCIDESTGRVFTPGVNDLSTLHPVIAGQWSDNNESSPEDIDPKSQEKFLWNCANGHEYTASIPTRVKGTGCPYCCGSLPHPTTRLDVVRPDLISQWSPENDKKISEVTAGSAYRAIWNCDKGHTWQAYVYARKNTGCPHCVSRSHSRGESELVTFVQELLPEGDVIAHDRTVIAPLEVDVYIPSRAIAIEYNGLYWHGEAQGKDRHYHYTKWKRCADAGVQLLTIWEDDWISRTDVVKSMVTRKLGCDTSLVIGAKKCVVMDLDYPTAAAFLDDYHVQGGMRGSAYLGLVHDGEVCAVMVMTNSGGHARLDRYATSVRLPGGFTKLLAHFLRGNYFPYDQVVTFADHQVSDGGLYEKTGFTADAQIRPDYMYVVGGVRCHKFNYRLKRFREDPALIWKEGASESELARLNGIDRVWDCGKTRYVLIP